MSATDEVDRSSWLSGYSDTVEALPIELQRNFTLIRQLDDSAQELMDDVSTQSLRLMNQKTVLSPKERQQRLANIGSLLNEVLKRGEEKFALAKSTYDTVDRHCTKLDMDLQKYEDEQLIGPTMGRSSTGTSTAGSDKHPETQEHKRKKRKQTRGRKKGNAPAVDDEQQQGEYLSAEDSKQHAQAAISLSNLPIDPNEPLYCYCQQVSFGEMVACDNDECEIEWFHLECVGLRTPPKGKWYCKNCAETLKIKQKK
ncbi:hypothetical protein K492DRAFT_159600 [Lichtheimia hyalospora FSU 10163]|nr:hypothetical protein K492DRAFT_159600 [Lichtheimia hyalospora FSU 10163]